MRDAGLVWLFLVVSGGLSCFAQETFPYRVTLGNGRIEVRSGPGTAFYVTDHLSEGDSIDVYRHHEDGWFGIRPPAGSFSWVPADHLAVANQASIARVVRDDTICRVGSRVAEVDQHVGQVYLEKEERVQLLDQLTVETQTAAQLEREGWRRISPPAGEFRWVRASDVKAATKPRIDRPVQASASAAASEPTDSNASSPEVRQAANWQPPAEEANGLTTAQVIQAIAVQMQGEPQEEPSQESSEAEPDGSETQDAESDCRLRKPMPTGRPEGRPASRRLLWKSRLTATARAIRRATGRRSEARRWTICWMSRCVWR
jgi:SH3-like domain-containing protein